MKSCLLAIFLATIFCVKGQYINNNIAIGKIDSIHSQVLKETRRIHVYVPNNDTSRVAGRPLYPVAYLLGSESRFFSLVNLLQQSGEVSGSPVIPQMIVVGIDNIDQTRDLTPTHVVSEPYFDSSLLKTSGGGENFSSYIEKELLPHIDSSYPTAPYRMLIGSSLGGLLTINTLVNHTNLFNSYVAIDPYMQWDNQNLLRQAEKVLAQKKFNNKSLFLAVGNTLQKGWDTVTVMKDTSEATVPIRSILQLASILRSNPSSGLNWSYKYYNVRDYNAVPLIGAFDGMSYFFSKYKLPSFQSMLDSAFNVDSAITTHFQEFSKQVGYTVLPPESFVNKLGNAFMLNKMFNKAYFFLRMNIDNYPKSFNTYDNMGDFYYVNGNNEKAIEYYTKALTLGDFPRTQQKLQRIKLGK